MFDVIVLDVAANSYEEITRHGVIFLQSLENFHFLRKSGRLDLLLANKFVNTPLAIEKAMTPMIIIIMQNTCSREVLADMSPYPTVVIVVTVK
jgi:hypothetical protein